jgi:hypothetical protein
VPPGAVVPQLTDDAVMLLRPLTGELIERLNKGEPMPTVAAAIAAKTAVTPGQVVRYVQALVAQSQAAKT